MKSPTTPQNQSPSAPRRAWLVPALTAICAGGAGITGTLLWMGSRTPVVTSTARIPAAASPTPVVADGAAMHQPPAALTAGLPPAQAALALGNWAYDHEQWTDAVGHYRRAIAGGIDNANVRTDLGNALRFSGLPKPALEQYLIARRQDPNHEQSLFNQGALWAVSLKNPKKGVAAWRAYLQKFPNGESAGAARQLIAQYEAGG